MFSSVFEELVLYIPKQLIIFKSTTTVTFTYVNKIMSCVGIYRTNLM